MGDVSRNLLAAPFEDAYWVDPGRFMAGPHPGGGSAEATRARTASLLEAGILCAINLTEPHEEKQEDRYEDVLSALASDRGLEAACARFALWDGTSPSPAAVKELLDVIDACLARDMPVYLHCKVGLGRTGVMVGCWLVRHGVARPRAAVRHISKLRRHAATARITSPSTREQIARVRSWKPGM
ncbi:MAG: dual specificity protein phosphatase family protein [Deltaproteobacteria bacterium]|nr:dual specificity protein phosphatase family protein [Deltaproteobacteria bacterium]